MENYPIKNVSEETKKLVSYQEDRFESEPTIIQNMRQDYAILIETLIKKRDSLERWEATRNLQIAITHAEDSCMRAVKAYYLSL